MNSGIFKVIRITLLFPFAGVVYLISNIRNAFYDRGIIRTIKTDLPTIVVGNLSVGGTGKTPHSEYIIKLLMENRFKVGFISRGYGRKTSGLIEIDPDSIPATVGDEPLQIYRKFLPKLKGCVSEDRVAGAAYLQTRYPDLNVLVLDDAYQHRRIARNLNILLTTFKNPFFQDFVMPAGTLREQRKGAARANAIVVTKCPSDISKKSCAEIRSKIGSYSKAPVFFSTFSNLSLGGFLNLENMPVTPTGSVSVMTGIADGEAFAESVSKLLPVPSKKFFRDHHSYTKTEVDQFSVQALQNTSFIITTEKDAVKLSALNKTHGLRNADKFFYLPVEVRFLFDDAEKFNQLVLSAVEGHAHA